MCGSTTHFAKDGTRPRFPHQSKSGTSNHVTKPEIAFTENRESVGFDTSNTSPNQVQSKG
eukprot:12916478-Prorocentrum_lima.AAC.1